MANLRISVRPQPANMPESNALRKEGEVPQPGAAEVELRGTASGLRRTLAALILIGLFAAPLYIDVTTSNATLAVLMGFLAAIPALALVLWASIELGTGLSVRDFIAFLKALGEAVGAATGRDAEQPAPKAAGGEPQAAHAPPGD
jgi:hypothetical protein